jgi:hypothetical protein
VPQYERCQTIANQMMKGCDAQLYKNGKPAPDKDMEDFRKKHKEIIDWVDEIAPARINAGVLGVIGKAALWYGKENVKEFCDRIANIDFKGEYDPCHLLWKYLLRLKTGEGRDTTKVYRYAVTAMMAFLKGGELKSLRPCNEDIFEWDKTYTFMRRARRNQTVIWQERCAIADTKLAEEIRTAADIKEALEILKED